MSMALQNVFIFLIIFGTGGILFFLKGTDNYINKAVNNVKQLKENIIDNLSTNYTILAASTPNYLNETIYFRDGIEVHTDRAWGYLFNLPLAALAWKRLGFKTIVIITVDYHNIQPSALRLLKYVAKILHQNDAIVMYFDVPSYTMVRLSQVSRLLAAEFDIVNENDYIITSDSDLWPLNPNRYKINAGKDIFITFAMCCGLFKYMGKTYRQYPLSNIAMRKYMWRKIFHRNIVGNHKGRTYTYENLKPFVMKLKNFLQYWVNSSDIYVNGRGNQFWYLDQHYASVSIGEYLDNVDNTTFQKINDFDCPRISTGNWRVRLAEKHKCYSDAHVFKNTPWRNWKDFKLLLVQMYDKVTLAYLDRYKKTFENIYEGFAD